LLTREKKINPVVFLLLATITIISLKWITSYLFYPSEPLINKIIFDLDDHGYFSRILNLLNLDFSPDYLLDYSPDNIVLLQFYYLIFYSTAYLIFGGYGFILIEYFSLFLFLYIFYKIFKELKINTYFSAVFALTVFLLPEFLIYLKNIGINLINFNILKNLYSFNIPRPIISSIYFFWGLLLAIHYYKYKKNNYFFILIGINLALNFASFTWHFIILSVLFSILFSIEILKNNKVYLLFLVKKIFLIFISFLLFALPFIVILFFAEKDTILREGAIYPNLEQKKILLNHLLFHFLSFRFLIVFFANTILLFFLLKKQNFFCKKTVTVLYLFFISSCISPFLFLLVTPIINEFYHFTDLVVVIGILLFFILAALVFATLVGQNVIIYKFYNFISKNNFCFILLILFLSITFNFNYFLNYKENSNPDIRKDVNTLYNYLSKNNYNQNINNILTFNTRIQVWWLFLEKKNLSTIHASFTPLNFRDLELSFINNLKFLNISEKNFQKIIDNRKIGWRYYNRYINYISTYKYQANSLTTYKNSKNFDNEVLTFIKNSSPLLTQQIAVPDEEIKRLTTLFKNTNNLNFNNPDIIILEKSSLMTQYSSINLNKYCVLKSTKYLDIYLNLKKTNCDLL
jgi:hypothetical protein|tara:strand:- start:401 stop:2293 length:1893 start_codon:yes stop_codon:yes gene_type:complete